jgi:hypothetical protein
MIILSKKKNKHLKEKFVSFLLVTSNYILNKSQGMGYISSLEWPLVLSLLAAWALVFICLCRGIKTSGKV